MSADSVAEAVVWIFVCATATRGRTSGQGQTRMRFSVFAEVFSHFTYFAIRTLTWNAPGTGFSETTIR